MPRPVVIDTNVFVSALWGSPSASAIYAAFRDGRFALAISDPLLDELTDVLNRPQFRATIAPSHVKGLLRLLTMEALLVPPPKKPVTVCRDPKDNAVLECAVSARAAWIVTGDKDLLVLSPFRGIRIVPPAQFVKRLKKL